MDERIARHLQADDDALAARWTALQAWLEARFGRLPGIEAILFLIGVQSRGRGYQPSLEKEAKQALIMEGTYHAFAAIDLYERDGVDDAGQAVWTRTGPPLPKLPIADQEKLLRTAILAYFDATVGARGDG